VTDRPPIRLILPYPPTINTYYRFAPGDTQPRISPKGRAYQTRITMLCMRVKPFRMDERLHMTIGAWVPDKRMRDIDNIEKPLIDSMEKAGIYPNDEQIDVLSIDRLFSDPIRPGVRFLDGEVYVTIRLAQDMELRVAAFLEDFGSIKTVDSL